MLGHSWLLLTDFFFFFLQGDPVPMDQFRPVTLEGVICLSKRVHLIGHETYRCKQLLCVSHLHVKAQSWILLRSSSSRHNKSSKSHLTYTNTWFNISCLPYEITICSYWKLCFGISYEGKAKTEEGVLNVNTLMFLPTYSNKTMKCIFWSNGLQI